MEGNADEIVKKLGIKIHSYDTDRENFLIRCPMPDHVDMHPSCSVHVEKGIWRCLSCMASGDFNFLISLLTGKSKSEVCNLLKGRLNPFVVLERSIRDLSSHEEYPGGHSPKAMLLPEEFVRITKSIYKKETNSYAEYLKSRNIGYDLIREFKLGFCEHGFYEGRIIVPVIVNGICCGFTARIIDKQVKKNKYLYPKGMSIGNLLYNIDNVVKRGCKKVYLVEGVFDVFAFYRAHIHNVVAIMGLNVTPRQIRLLLLAGVEEIKVAVDRDVDNTSLDKLYDALYEFFDLYRVKPSAKDFGEMKPADLRDSIKVCKRVKYVTEGIKELNMLKSPRLKKG